MDTSQPANQDRCIVCGKATSKGRGFMTLYLDEKAVEVCCPHCYKTFEEDPAHFLSEDHIRQIESDAGLAPDW